jgi:muconolactone delta-isomerase
MLFYMQMRWNIENRITLEDVWDMEVKEGPATSAHFKVVAMYKVVGQRRVIAIVDMESAEALDRSILGHLPMREYLDFEAIWPLRTFAGFLEDCSTHFGARATKGEELT